MSRQYSSVHRPADANLTLTDEHGTIRVQKLVSQGERLEISDEHDEIKLDSLLLEGLSWQRERGVLADVIGDLDEPDPVPLTGGDPDDSVDEVSISNEYSHTTVRKIHTAAGEAIQIETPARGTSINLGVRSLRALTTVSDTYVFSEWFRTPFGPEDDPVEGPL
ncbi:hypothetical protein [Halorientalis pallida]|uniref:Uncharacterized protein n=1 Tax=Halorientalis pallida TaxID=2479928 RepID=A0A498KUP0_9EURY|nr:hypothetical protein [Halorientalis pallida]RXK47964.1 hypothetical protein EAF64_15130 [Halorientalis pallida]